MLCRNQGSRKDMYKSGDVERKVDELTIAGHESTEKNSVFLCISNAGKRM